MYKDIYNYMYKCIHMTQEHIPCLKSTHISPERTYRVHKDQTCLKSNKLKILPFSQD